jgi:hypothetical protein
MKHILFKYALAFGCVAMLLSSFSHRVLASVAEGNAKKEMTRLKLYYYKLDDGKKLLSMELTAGRGRNSAVVAGADIHITTSANDSTREMATVTTDSAGSFLLYVEPGYPFLTDSSGFTTIEAVFDGNDTLRSTSQDVQVKDARIDFVFDIIDSVQTLTVKATDFIGNPLEEVDINIGVQRLFSVLPLDRIETDEDGMASLEIEAPIPGDSAGMLEFVARIDDSDDYGTVTAKSHVDWGVKVDYTTDGFARQLWTDEAPLWMVIAVFVILIGAWYHFILSILKLRKIRMIGESG